MKTLFLNVSAADKRKSIEELSSFLGLKTEYISNKDLDKTVLTITRGSVPGMPDRVPVQIPLMYNLPEIIIFSGFEEDEVRVFLSEYKSRGIERIALKCMVTPFNIGWSLFKLVEHLKEEAGIK